MDPLNSLLNWLELRKINEIFIVTEMSKTGNIFRFAYTRRPWLQKVSWLNSGGLLYLKKWKINFSWKKKKENLHKNLCSFALSSLIYNTHTHTPPSVYQHRLYWRKKKFCRVIKKLMKKFSQFMCSQYNAGYVKVGLNDGMSWKTIVLFWTSC